MSYISSRPANGKRQQIFRDLCESFGYGEPTFTYLEKTLWGPFQVGVTMEVLGVSGKIFSSLGLVDLANCCVCVKLSSTNNLKQLYSVLPQLKDQDGLGSQQRTMPC